MTEFNQGVLVANELEWQPDELNSQSELLKPYDTQNSNRIGNFLDVASRFICRYPRAVRAVGAVGLASVACAVAPDVSIARQSDSIAHIAQAKVTPNQLLGSAISYDEMYISPERGRFTSGAMNYVAHLELDPHTFEVTGPCNILAKNPNNANNMSFVRINLQGDYEVSCAYGDKPVEKSLVPLKEVCFLSTQTECKDMNYEPELASVQKKVETYVGLPGQDFGKLNKLIVNTSRAKRTSNAELYFTKTGGSAVKASSSGRKIKEIILSTTKSGKETIKKIWYKPLV